MSHDPLDERLRALGQGTPFPVDWQAYERRLLERLAVAQKRRARRALWIGLAGTLAGAAATLLFSLALTSPPEVRERTEARNPPAPAGQGTPRPEVPAVPKPAPVVLRRVGRDGEVEEIRYSPVVPREKAAGIIVHVENATR